MGASFGAEEEYLTLDDMVAKFSLDHLNPAPARVNFEKLDHYNGLAIRQMDAADLAARLAPFFQQAGLEAEPDDLLPIVPILRERIVTLDDAVAMAGFFFRPPPRPAAEDLQVKGLTPAQSLVAVSRARALLESLPAEQWAHEALEARLRALADELGVKAGQLFSLLRVAVTGQTVSPPLMETMAILGRARTLESVRYAEGVVRPQA
jgi:glutamyl-tRNA synthetase